MPSPAATSQTYSAGIDTTNLVSPLWSPVNGDVFVVKLTTWDANNPMGAVSGGGQIYQVVNTSPAGGFNGWSQSVVCTVAGSPAPFQITGAGTANPSRHSMIVEYYPAALGFSLAASPATNAVKTGIGLPSAAITTVGTGSVLSWSSVDVSSVDPATRVPLLSATEDGLFDGHVGANSVQYFYYATAGAPGAYTIGMSAPGGQTWVMTGVEVLFTPPSTANPVVVVNPPPRRRLLRQAIIVVGEGSPPPPPTPADVEWCAQTPITGWMATEVITGWDASDPGTNWLTVTPEEDC